MWIADKIFDHLTGLRADLADARAERDALKAQNATLIATNDWQRLRVNALEVERAVLMEKAFNVKMPIPEIVRPAQPLPGAPGLTSFTFEDIGDEAAKLIGLPTYNS